MNDTTITTTKALPKHPLGLYLLALTAMWEYFSYYGMRALFVLYMTKVFLFTDEKSYGIYGAFGALVYVTSLTGAWLTEKFLGYRMAICLGGVLIAIGNIMLSVTNTQIFYAALAIIVCGNGLCKPNIVNLVGQLYPAGDSRRDSAFTLFYVGANLGAFIAPLICGLVSVKYGWGWSFAIAGVGMLFGLSLFVLGRKHIIISSDQIYNIKSHSMWKKALSIPLVIALTIFLTWTIQHHVSGILLNIIGIGLLVWLILQAIKSPAPERKRIFLMLALLFFGTLFWAFDMQVDSSITLFTDRIVDRTFFGWTIPTPMFQSINPFVIFSMGPIFSWLWFKLSQRKKDLCVGYKFSLALVQVGLGFLVLSACAHLFAHTGHVSFLWVVFTYFLISTGELCCEPIGLASANRLPPRHLIGMMIAAWYLYTGSYANYLASFIAKFTSVDNKISLGDLHSASLTYAGVFNIIVLSSISIGIILAIGTMITNKFYAVEKSKVV